MENNIILGWDITNIDKNDFLNLLKNIKEYYENPLNAEEDDEDIKIATERIIKNSKTDYMKLNIVEFIGYINNMSDLHDIKEAIFDYLTGVYCCGCFLLVDDYIGIDFGQRTSFNNIKRRLTMMGLNPLTMMVRNMIGEDPQVFAINIPEY